MLHFTFSILLDRQQRFGVLSLTDGSRNKRKRKHIFPLSPQACQKPNTVAGSFHIPNYFTITQWWRYNWLHYTDSVFLTIHSLEELTLDFVGRTDAEAETPILWPPDSKNWLTGKIPCCWERLRAGGKGDDRGWDGWMTSLTSMNMSLSKLQNLVMDREAWCAVVHGVSKNRTWLSDWTELNWLYR